MLALQIFMCVVAAMLVVVDAGIFSKGALHLPSRARSSASKDMDGCMQTLRGIRAAAAWIMRHKLSY